MKKKLMTHLVCWYPTISKSEELFKVLAKYSKYVEVQFPFSDPIADWPIISSANEISLKNWITTNDCFNFINDNISWTNSNILIMTYYNIIYNYWVENFVKRAKSIWIYGLIIPDLPFDEKEWEELIYFCNKYNINLIQVISSSCDKKRLEKIFKLVKWFLYVMSDNMTTWNKIKLKDDFKNFINNLKKTLKIDIWIWFWIKTKSDIDEVLNIADFAIIWSEIINIYNNEWLNGVEEFLEGV